MNSPITPLKNKIVAIPIEEKKEEIFSGFIIATQNKERPIRARVVGIGSEVDTIQVDDVILFAKYSPHEIVIGNQVYLILLSNDILGILLQPSN